MRLMKTNTLEGATASRRCEFVVPLGVLLLATLLFRLPPLLNASAASSDAMIVGLQAKHMLHGELSPWLWGVRYQGTLDPLLMAAMFRLAGQSALTMMLVPLAGYLLVVGMVFDLLRRRLLPWAAALATLPIIFTPQAINGVVLYAPRQWCMVLVFAAIRVLDGASSVRRPLWHYGVGAFLGTLALYVDLFALQFLGPVGLFGLLCCTDGEAGASRAPRVRACLVGLALGGGLLLALHLGDLEALLAAAPPSVPTAASVAPVVTPPPAAITAPVPASNLTLLLHTCLPWLLGSKVFVPGPGLYPEVWRPPAALRIVQLGGGLLLGLGIALGPLWLLTRRVPWALQRLGVLGFVAAVTALLGFLVSSSPRDMWSARYLAPILWMAPFALSPLAFWLGTRALAAWVLPYALVAALGGWVSYGPYVQGARPARTPEGVGRDQAQLANVLRQHGVHYAVAQYWLSYRLTFLFDEDPIVSPIDPQDDRYPPYRHGFLQAPVAAYIFHPAEPRSRVADYEPALRAQPGTVERLEVAGFTVLIHQRR
jgi:hypothetical protein